MFRGMAPVACSCLVGNYRGFAGCPALVNYAVHVPADRRVGVQPGHVGAAIYIFESRYVNLQNVLNVWKASARKAPPQSLVLTRLVEFLAESLEQFFLIHPYANGNGHAGRLLIHVLLRRNGFPPKNWPLDASPAYGSAITAYRNGNKVPLHDLLLQAIF